MKRRIVIPLVAASVLLVFLMSCSPKTQAPLQKPETGPGAGTGQAISEKVSSWDELVTLAKKEKRLSLYSVANGDLKAGLIKAVRDKFGMELDMITGRAAELSVKLFNERKAGIYSIDVYIGGAGTLINELKPAGIFEPLEPQLFLPEVVDPAVWWGGKLPFIERDRQVFAFVANPSPALAINTNLVGREEIKSYVDLLNPKWKGKMILNDPTTPGVSQFWFGVANTRIMNVDYMRKLAQMDLIVTRDQRLQVEWLSQGKVLVAIAAQQSTVSQFQKDGAPVELITPKEGTHVTSSSGNLAILSKVPHPYAAKMFINWILSREGQTIFSQGVGFQSARLDVPTGHLPTDSVRKPDIKYFSSMDEEFITTLPEQAKIAREIFGPLMK